MRAVRIFSLFIFFILLGSSAVADQDVTVQGCWAIDPIVKVCSSSHANQSQSRVMRALGYWERLGYKFESVIFNDNSPSCLGEPGIGEIIIRTPDQTFNHDFMAVTKRTVTVEERMLLYSVIHIKDVEVANERTLEHEIGHAIGWNHSKARYHIMHEEWRYGGSSSFNVSFKSYVGKCGHIIQ